MVNSEQFCKGPYSKCSSTEKVFKIVEERKSTNGKIAKETYSTTTTKFKMVKTSMMKKDE